MLLWITGSLGSKLKETNGRLPWTGVVQRQGESHALDKSM